MTEYSEDAVARAGLIAWLLEGLPERLRRDMKRSFETNTTAELQEFHDAIVDAQAGGEVTDRHREIVRRLAHASSIREAAFPLSARKLAES